MSGEVVFCCGADDPEMRAIIALLREQRRGRVVLATVEGKRVHPGNAYLADPIPGAVSGDTLVLIECAPKRLPDGVNVVLIDHHHPDDPGWGEPPEHFWAASSIGQLYALLGCIPTYETLVLAAMDHCFCAAIQGGCPGVHSSDVLALKIEEIAKTARVSTAEVERRIAHYRRLVRGAPAAVKIGDQWIVDLRSEPIGVGWSFGLLAVQVAVVLEECVALLRHQDYLGGPWKVTLTGCAHSATVRYFMNEWAPRQGLVRIYGVPARGYAGGYFA